MANDDDEMEMILLREQVLKSLLNNKRSEAAATTSSNSNPPENVPRIPHNNNNNPQPAYPVVHDQRPMPMQPQHTYSVQYGGGAPPRPYNSQYSTYHPQQGAFQPINPMIPIVPHVNVNFHSIPFNQAIPLAMNGGGGVVPMDTTHKYEPTPPARLSPRSAQFVAANEAAMRNSGQRNKTARRSRSSSRSRSRSPRPYKKRSRSPHIDHIARKRRDQLSDSRPPRWQNGQPNRARPFQKGNQKKFFDRNNGRAPLKKSPEVDKTSTEPTTSQSDHRREKEEKNGKEKEAEKSTVTEKAEKPPKVEPKREKTKEEIEEDELLKSTDEEDNGDEISLTLDENELDFLEDDEEESEGRFKSKPTSTRETAKPKPIFDTKYDRVNKRNNNRHFDSRNSNNNNNNRRSRSPFRHQKKPDYSMKNSFRDNKPEKSASSSSVVATTSNGSSSSSSFKDNKESTSSKSSKSAVSAAPAASSSSSSSTSVRTSVKDDSRDSQKPSSVSDNRIRLNRNKIPSRVEMVKPTRSESDNAPIASTGKSEKAIMKRLGGFVGDVKPSSWPQNQINKILYENLVRDHGCRSHTMSRCLAAIGKMKT